MGVFGQVRAEQKRFLRDKTSLFFTFLFPLIFLFVFGSIFNNQTINFKVVIINHSSTEFAKQFVEQAKKGAPDGTKSPLKVQHTTDMAKAKEQMKRSEIDGIIELPADFGAPGRDHRPNGTLQVLYQKGSEQSGKTLTAVMTQIIDDINKGMGQPEPPLKVAAIAIGSKGLTSFDYTFTGLLAFSLMSMGIFGLSNAMPTEKQKGSYRRLRAAPFTSGQLIIAAGIHYTIVSVISAAMMMAVGIAVFHFNMQGNWLLFSGFAVLSAALLVSFGLLIGGWAKNENQAPPLSNLVAFPMMFLSGAFFPAYLFPEWLQGVSRCIPMTYVVDGLRLITTENASVMAVLPQIGMVIAFTVVVYAAAIKLFRWE